MPDEMMTTDPFQPVTFTETEKNTREVTFLRQDISSLRQVMLTLIARNVQLEKKLEDLCDEIRKMKVK